MLPGITGSLVASAFLERVLLQELQGSQIHSSDRKTARALHSWWARVERALGPASSARAVLDLGMLPFVELMGFDVLHVEPHAGGFVGTLGCHGSPAAVLLTTRWGSDADKAWRDTVRASRTARARWGLVFNGPTLRIVDGRRTWSRRGLQFDLARVVADERSVAVMCALVSADTLSDASNGFCRLEQVVRRIGHARR